MTSKDHWKYLKDKNNLVLNNSTDVYNNFNLNETHKCLTAIDHTRSKVFQNRIPTNSNYDVTEKITSQKDSNSLKKFQKNMSKDYFTTSNLNNVKEESKNFLNSNNKSSNSTLSLHIAAYENFIKADDSLADRELQKKNTTTTTPKNLKQQCAGSLFNDQFEFPRQQENKPIKPEVQQFTASQKLFTPIQKSFSPSFATQPFVARILEQFREMLKPPQPSIIGLQQIRQFHFSPLQAKKAIFKPRIARTKPIKTPSTLALDNFDFYYGPLFGDQWPSIRLGLLTPNKFVAVLNRFSSDVEVNESILQSLGTKNIMDYLISGKDISDPRIKEKKKKVLKKPLRDIEGDVWTEEEVYGKTNEDSKPENIVEGSENVGMRLEGGLYDFKQPSETYTMGKLNMPLEDESSKKKSLDKIEVTGVERFHGNLLQKEDFLVYPRSLRLYCYPPSSLADFPGPIKDKKDISSWWLLDGGSIIPVLALDLKADDNVLDMCSAPGGKSLLIAQTGLFDKLTCTDAKLSRIGQLRRGLSMYIPAEAPEASKIIIKRRDASLFDGWTDEGIYDKVLVDAPCTTDRLSVNQDEGNLFSPAMTQTRLNLPQLQVKLLVNALRSVKVGGTVVYSTCSLSPMQNDAVVENAAVIAEQEFGIKCLEKPLTQLRNHLMPSGLFRFAKNYQRGLLIVPYLLSNFGPMYVCKLQKIR